VVVSPSLINFDACTYLYNPQFDLGIGEEWLPKYPPYEENTVSPAASTMETSGPPAKLSKLFISLKKDKAEKMTLYLKDCSKKITNNVRTTFL